MSDIIVVASSPLEPLQWDVEEVFRSAGLVVNGEESESAIPEVQFRGHHATAESIMPL